jgi:DNA-binding NarL/FixJ family response regulator
MSASHSSEIRVILIDDHTLVRAGLSMLLNSQAGIRVVGEAADRASAIEVIRRERPDIVLLDPELGTEQSIHFLPELLAAGHSTRVILLASKPDPPVHHEAVRLGAVGIVLKEQSPQVLFKAIHKVYAGEVWLDRAMMASVLAELGRRRSDGHLDPEAVKIATLTDRERDVVALIGEGLKNKHIAERLSISETTVRHHLTSIFDKLGVADRLELMKYAYEHDLVSVSR